MKRISHITIALCVLGLVVTLSGCQKEMESEPIIMVDRTAIEATYNMDEISRGDVTLTKKVSSEYVQTEDQQVSFKTGGKIVDKVYVKVGDYVNVGDLLLTMDCGDILDQISDLEYQIAKNKLLLGYLDKAEEFDKQSEEYTYIYEYQSPDSDEEISKHNHKIYLIEEDYAYQREDYNDNIEFDTAKLNKLRSEYEDNHVYAELSGKVMNIKTDLEGSVAKKDDVIMSIVDNDNGLFVAKDEEITSFFSEKDIVPMSIIYGSAKGDYELRPVKIDEWGQEQIFEVVSAPQNATLEVGVSGTIIATVDKRTNVLRIPNKALYEADGRYYTYILGDNNMREPRFIEIGLVGDDFSEITSGIEMGMKVVSR